MWVRVGENKGLVGWGEAYKEESIRVAGPEGEQQTTNRNHNGWEMVKAR
jgi:hypothetical protein